MEDLVLDEDRVAATFDTLVAREIICYGEEEIRRVNDNGFDVSR